MQDPDPSTLKHTPLEDLQALLIGTLLVSLAVTLFQHAGLLSGGTAGIAFLAHYLGGWSFGVAYFVINLPFYWLAWRHMGRSFTLRTLAAVVLVAVMSDWLPRHLVLASLDAWLAALLGGVLMGNGFLVLFRHHASLGGLGILALLAQKKRGWRAGHVQMAMDSAIVLAALATVPLDRVALSVAAAVVLNLVIATNHRPGRYVAQ
ncbi:YitT family protein [Piscinibacter gummiphilus]|uniref:YitT family protein n=1 Tax=Piscinibacter gummiphilus TaxID=946333 RepID=A0ABZ0CV71_9BURK|nr:YitT family protein [Piscinibacter gummiphilus]WOB08867.1 YitT family protein [Piscinibacter gummiphilus]